MATTKSQMIQKVLFNRFHKENARQFLQSLPPTIAQELISLPITSDDVSPFFSHTTLQRIHYSWLIFLIQQQPKTLQPYYVWSLNASQAEPLCRLLPLPLHPPLIAPSIKQYFSDKLWKMLTPPSLMPLPFLPPVFLSPLLEWDYKDLLELIDFLGIYDLASTVKRIVDRNQLKKIYNQLSPKKLHFLRLCLQYQDRIQASPLKLERWDGSKASLDKILHQRGIIRLIKALSGQPKDALWYLTRSFDRGHGLLIEKEVSEKETPGVTLLLREQVSNVMKILKPSGNV